MGTAADERNDEKRRRKQSEGIGKVTDAEVVGDCDLKIAGGLGGRGLGGEGLGGRGLRGRGLEPWTGVRIRLCPSVGLGPLLALANASLGRGGFAPPG